MSRTVDSQPAWAESNCTALVFDQEKQCWLQFTEPDAVLTARTVEEVHAVIESIEKATGLGMTAVGYVAYEAANAFDSSLPTYQPCTPLVQFSLYKASQCATLDNITAAQSLLLKPSTDRASYEQQFFQIRALLESGEIYQVNLSHQLRNSDFGTGFSTLALFQQLYKQQASSRSVYYRSSDLTLMSVSPELFFSLQGEKIYMEPMKGTRPRGESAEQDLALREELLESEKEQAENLMIVDMVRNDLGKIARPGSVKVEQLFGIVELPTLWQKVSGVSALTDASLLQIFSALFPCASITGAPKRRSMEVIRQLETEARGVYTGAIGIIQPQRRMQFSVAIRTLVATNDEQDYSYGVGSGVVWDSQPEDEWQETLHKAEITRALYQPMFALLETMAYYPDIGIFLLDYHLERLANSARHLDFELDLEAVGRALAALCFDAPTRLRLLLKKDGDFELQHLPVRPAGGVVQLQLATQAINRKNLLLQHKTTRRDIYESLLADVDNCDDVLLWNEHGELTETCIYNVYLQLGENLLTPHHQSGLLPGTYRRMMLETGQAHEAVLTLEDLDRASALFVSNSVQGLREARLVRQTKHSMPGSIR